MRTCIVCGQPVHAHGRCHSCYVYWRGHNGQDRTEEQAIRAIRLSIERLKFHQRVRKAVIQIDSEAS